jgi:hypothetical protein
MEVRRRTIPERLRWIAEYIEAVGDQDVGARMGLSMGLREIADEVYPLELDDGTYDKLDLIPADQYDGKES